jgi:2-keto-4-pentenoate hydratase/2-oxohepta-3-ene-1,7-dioic acid hydratase in catechol pathway
MRLANAQGRLVLGGDDGFVDVAHASGGRFDSDPQAVYERWDEFEDWARGAAASAVEPVEPRSLGPPVPRPRQVFAVGFNYAEHAAEGGFSAPETPLIFTKYPTCLVGPRAAVELATPKVDWEVELVAVIGRRAWRVEEGGAWRHVAGLTVGQDLSARDVQRLGEAPQFSLGKSFPGFGPTGPWVATPDELDAEDARIECYLNDERVQGASTAEMIFTVPALIAYLSAICPLLPGDLLFTGTPSGVGSRRDPPRFLREGDELRSRIEGIGEIVQTFHEGEAAPGAAATPGEAAGAGEGAGAAPGEAPGAARPERSGP